MGKPTKGISGELRRRWDGLIAAEGARLGLADCRVFLENKLVNDLFYEGTFAGRPCIVKCSSRAPASIRNEYEMSRRLFAVAPVCAEPLARFETADGRMAFAVTERLPGPSLTDLLVRGPDADEAANVFEDMVRIAEALAESGIVWRDVIPDNFLFAADGHLRLIDAQFAFDRRDFREDPYLLAHWKYRHLLFAHHPMTNGHGWNDVAMMVMILRHLEGGAAAERARRRLGELAGASAFPVAPSALDLLRMRGVALAIALQYPLFLFNPRKRQALDMRWRRARRFLRREFRPRSNP